MTARALTTEALVAPTRHAVSGATVGDLTAIADPCINLAVWRRPMSPALVKDARRLLAQARGMVRVNASPDAMAAHLGAAIASAGWSPVPALVDDVGALVQAATRLMNADSVEVRLEVVTTDACRKFHADHVSVRLITTYAGPGSQWLCNDDAAALAAGIPIERLVIRELLAGEVALFKGRLSTDRPIVHRSPPIAGTGQRRLVLVINPAEAGCC